MQNKHLILALVTGLTLTPTSNAAVITQEYNFTLPSNAYPYSAGHAFTVTATYDDEDTTANAWYDGPNGIGQLGADDDSLFDTRSASPGGYTMVSEATISITGLIEDTMGGTPDDWLTTNWSWVYAVKDPATNGFLTIQYHVDTVSYLLQINGPNYSSSYPNGSTRFNVAQRFLHPEGYVFATQSSAFLPYMIAPREGSTVPEPASIALLGLGMAGLMLVRTRKGQAGTA